MNSESPDTLSEQHLPPKMPPLTKRFRHCGAPFTVVLHPGGDVEIVADADPDPPMAVGKVSDEDGFGITWYMTPERGLAIRGGQVVFSLIRELQARVNALSRPPSEKPRRRRRGKSS